MWLLLTVLIGPAHASCEDTAEPWDTGIEQDVDCDGDGVTPAEGDCDDMDSKVQPLAEEICGDAVDNNCDGFYDEGCDRAAWRGRLQGGTSCGSGGVAASLMLPLLFVTRRLW